jgi:cobalamin biosynthesis protein CobD/CbiB
MEDTNGWDVVIETLTDEQIAVLTGKTGGFAGARVRVSKWVRRDPKFLASLPADFAS